MNMNDNKHINKLATQIVKKQDDIDGYLHAQIEVAQKNLQLLLNTKRYAEEDIAYLKKQQEDLKNHKAGRLAKVSLYEFVNDWVRPEISFKIFSYLADPHKEGINKARTHRLRFQPSHLWGGGRRSKAVWAEQRKFYPEDRHEYRNNETPYCELPLYKEISSPYFQKNSTSRRFYEKMSHWVMGYGEEGWGNKELSVAKYRNTNPLLLELWSFHQTKFVNNNLHKKFITTKGDIKKYLTLNKVNERTDLTYGVKCSETCGTDEILGNSDGTPNLNGNSNIWLAPEARRELVGALMKI